MTTSPVSRDRLDAILNRTYIPAADAKWLLDRAEEAIASRDRITALEAEVERLREARDSAWQHYDEQVADNADLTAERDALRERVAALEAAAVALVHTWEDRCTAAEAERDALAQRVAAVRALHGDPTFCRECREEAPCPTVAVLDGVTVPDDPRIAEVRALCEGKTGWDFVDPDDLLAILDGEAGT